jgi:hypothetical protein
MLMWFASGVAMLFVHWPEVSEAERAAGLPAIAWARCCDFGAIRDEQQVTHAVVEDLAGRPVLRFDGEVLDLASGALLHQVSAQEAAKVADAYVHAPGGTRWRTELVARDQWTVTGYFDKRGRSGGCTPTMRVEPTSTSRRTPGRCRRSPTGRGGS